MPTYVTVNIPASLDHVNEVESSNPEVMETILGAAKKYMTGHRRFVGDGQVFDLDEYASPEDYDKFLVEAGDAVRKHGELLGSKDSVWTSLED
jgi:hypothetical protein